MGVLSRGGRILAALALASVAACTSGAGAPDGAPVAVNACPPKTCDAPNPGCDYCGTHPDFDYGHCLGQEVYLCDPTTGQWRDDGLCNPPALTVDSDLTFDQPVGTSAGACGLDPPQAKTIHVNSADGNVTATALTIQDATITVGLESADVAIEASDAWIATVNVDPPIPVTISYRLHLDAKGYLTGTGVARYDDGSGPCALGMTITGTWDSPLAP